MMAEDELIVLGATEHNLKNVDVRIPRNTLTVVTGPSGSGKSSLAFDTIYAEGQRRYIESLSAYARQFLDRMQKPHVESITGLSPAISIEQKSVSRNPRSTVGTVTEIYDYLRVLYATIGKPHCPSCGQLVGRQSLQQIAEQILNCPEGTRLAVMAPVVRGRKGEYGQLFEQAVREGFARARVDGQMCELESGEGLDASRLEGSDESGGLRLKKHLKHTIEIVVDRIILRGDVRLRLVDALEIATKKAEGLVSVYFYDGLPQAGGRKKKAVRGKRAPARKSKARDDENVLTFSEQFACNKCDLSFDEILPRTFSFNSPFGSCPSCHGLGTQQDIDEDLVVPDRSLSISEGAVRPWSGFFRVQPGRRGWDRANWNFNFITATARHFGIDLETPWRQLPREQQEILLYGSGETLIALALESRKGAKYENRLPFEGAITNLKRRLHQTTSSGVRDWIMSFYSNRPCEECAGQRLNPVARAVTLGGRNITEFVNYIAFLKTHTVAFKSSTEPFDSTTPEGELMMNMLALLADYFRKFLSLAQEYDAGYVLDSQTWKAHVHWAEDLEEDEEALHEANKDSIAFLASLRDEYSGNSKC